MAADDLIRELVGRVRGTPAREESVVRAEREIFVFPPLLRRLYLEVADGRFGPDTGLLPIEPFGEEGTLVETFKRFAAWEEWPERLLPICDWGCAVWSCVDCRSMNGAVVTCAEDRFVDSGRDLESWLHAWMSGVNLWEEMFYVGPPMRERMNPFTKKPEQVPTMTLQGRPWPTEHDR